MEISLENLKVNTGAERVNLYVSLTTCGKHRRCGSSLELLVKLCSSRKYPDPHHGGNLT